MRYASRMTTAACDLPLAERLLIGKRLTRAVFGQPEPAIVATMIAILMEHPDADERLITGCLSEAHRLAKALSRPPCPHATALLLQRITLEAAHTVAIRKGIDEGRIRVEAEEDATAPAATTPTPNSTDGEDPIAEVERGEPPAVPTADAPPATSRRGKKRLY